MSRFSGRWRLVLCAGAVLLAVSGCTSGSTDGPTTTAPTAASLTVTPSVVDVSTPPPSPTPSVASVPATSEAPPTPTSLDPAAQEAADRAAVEAQWVKFWNVYGEIIHIPRDQRADELAAVSIPPLSDKLLAAADKAESDGIDNYGPVTHRIFWQFPIGGASEAVIADCQDQSQTGTVEVATGKILTVGRERDNMRGEYVKGSDGIWRLQQITVIGDKEC